MIRQAETKDIPHIIKCFGDLLAYLKSKGVDRFAADANQYIGGIIEYVALKMNSPGHVILTDGAGILIGMVEGFPGFMKHRKVGIIEYVYPLSFGSTPIAHKFYEWAKDKGATAVMCLAHTGQEKVIPMYERQGFGLQQFIMVKEL